MSALTEKGLLSARPAPATNPAGYYYATDEGKYYKSNGDNWVEISTDFQDIDPRTKVSLMAGLDGDGTLDVVKLNNDGSLKTSNTTLPGFNIPTFDKIEMTYVGTTSNVNTVVYKLGATTVGTLTFAYVDASVENAKITSITLS